MYIPHHFEEKDVGVLHALMRAQPLGTWVVASGGQLTVNHIPFLVDEKRGEFGTLVGHVARANPVWKLPQDASSVVVFQGPQGYISPSWYPSKRAHGKAVPTWNYAVVHAHGTARAIDDRDWLLQLVTRLTERHEAGQAVPWRVSDAPADFTEQMLKAIVGIEMPIRALEGKWKTSQNRPLPDKLGTIAGLQERGDAQAKEMAALVEKHAR